MRYFVLESTLLAYYKRKPQDNVLRLEITGLGRTIIQNEGLGSKKPVSKEVAMEEPLEVIISTKPDNFTPRVVEKKEDYIQLEYESPTLGKESQGIAAVLEKKG
ncbi:hypothetical protein L2E82_40207 [Cichorium intybus]|uniref:Uncharacterized protein n=1 Tax=Cichorium intybus TaxID=13427 RepID=A0ACB9AKQ1_CICIN|nr:hypothetical protein L2E82_40207 [Cichorium intybus]